jgi:predicted dienelactone hydrolase
VKFRWVCALLVAAGLGVAGCGGSSHAHASSAPPTGPCGRTLSADLGAPGPYRVDSAHLRLTRRATTSAQVRHIDPTAWFPAGGRSGCRFAVIVFSHGANGRPQDYQLLVQHLASDGFVVLAPQHPDRGAQGDERTERVADVTYLLDHLSAIAARLAPGLDARLDASRIGIAGHSFGGFVAAYEAVHERRVGAALVMAGGLRSADAARTRVPVLAMAGGTDTLIPAAGVRDYVSRLPASRPHAYLEIAGADHGAYGDHCVAEDTCGIVGAYASALFLTYLDHIRGADALLDPRKPHPDRVRLQTVRMP